MTIPCPVCGAPFDPSTGRGRAKRYCSRACQQRAVVARALARRKERRAAARGTRTCPVCGHSFTPKNTLARYCSTQCLGAATRRRAAGKPINNAAFAVVRYARSKARAPKKPKPITVVDKRKAETVARGADAWTKVWMWLELPAAERYARRGELTRAEHALAQKIWASHHARAM